MYVFKEVCTKTAILELKIVTGYFKTSYLLTYQFNNVGVNECVPLYEYILTYKLYVLY